MTWSFQAPITQLEGSELLDETSMTYRHYIQVNGTFIAGINVSCTYTVNGQTDSVNYSLKGLIKRLLTIHLQMFLNLSCSSFRSSN